jgi:transaldolase
VKFYVDSADADLIRACVKQGLATGACAMVTAQDRDGMLQEARALARVAGDVGTEIAVRLPCTEDGLAAARICAAEGIRIEIASCGSPAAAVRAAQAGAHYVSPPTAPTAPD